MALRVAAASFSAAILAAGLTGTEAQPITQSMCPARGPPAQPPFLDQAALTLLPQLGCRQLTSATSVASENSSSGPKSGALWSTPPRAVSRS